MSIIKGITLEEEMKKDPQLKLSDIQLLREWCEKQPHLPKIEDSFLALFFHCKYYQMEPTKNMIENYYTTRTHSPEIFCNRDPLVDKGLQQIFKYVTIFPLNGVTKDGYRMMYGTLLNGDPSIFVFNDVLKYALMMSDTFFLMDGTSEGTIIILDADKLSFGHVTRINPFVAKKFLYYVQEAAPLRIKGIHIINARAAVEMVLNILKHFMKQKLIALIHIHSSSNIYDYVPMDPLPNEVGGKAGSTYELAEIQVKKIKDCREWFQLDEGTRRVNEALRIGKTKLASNLFGVLRRVVSKNST